MKPIEIMYENVLCCIILIVGITAFMNNYTSTLQFIDEHTRILTEDNVMRPIPNYSHTQEKLTRAEIIGILMTSREYDIIIDDVLFSKDSFKIEEFNFWSLEDKKYGKELEYNIDGTVKYVIFKSI